MDLQNSRYASGNSNTNLNFTNLGNGQYRISVSGSWNRTYYLRYRNDDWSGSTTSSTVFLYKLTEYVAGHDVTYEGNGYTSGTLPENAQKCCW